MAKLRNFDEFQDSLKDFSWLEDSGISGTDIDWIREKKGKIVILEGKRIQDKVIKVKYAQYQMMKVVLNGRGRAFIVGYYSKSDKVYPIDIDTIENKHFHYDARGELIKEISIENIKPIFRKAFALEIKDYFKKWGVF